MRSLERLSFGIQLKARFSTVTGDEFQRFFSDVMVQCHPEDFQRVCPWGSDGDRKNDGYLPSERKLFQCYAPAEMEMRRTEAKVEEDFTAALPYWKEHFDEWVFVHNVVRGHPAFVVNKLANLQKMHQPLLLTPWGYDEVSGRVLRLSTKELTTLLGPPLTDTALSELEFQDLAVVVKTVAARELPSDSVPRPVPADKLFTNQLSVEVEDYLRVGMRKADLVGRFFDAWHDVTLGERTAKAFRDYYSKLKVAGLSPDEIFFELQTFAGGALMLQPKQSAAVLAVLAYLFEQCDIFEAARSGVAA